MALNPAQLSILSSGGQQQSSGLSAEQLAMLGMEPKAPADSQMIRSLAQGATFGFAEEIEAGVRAAASMLGIGEDRGYEAIRDEIRQKLANFKKESPGTAITAEIVGAIIPTVAAVVASGGTAAPAALGRLAGIGAVEGGLTGLGTSESKTIGGMAGDATTGAITGAALSPALVLGGRQVASKAGAIVDWAKSKLGDKASNAVQAELQRLQQQSKKPVEEIIADLESGRLMTDNMSLMVALKGYVTEGGKAGRRVLDQTKSRAQETGRTAESALMERLAPNMDENVVRGFKRTEQELLDAESASYKNIFRNSGIASEDLVNQTTSAVQSLPSVVARLDRLYGAQGKIPPYSIKDGKVVMNRTPTLEDAEKIRGALSEETQAAFRGGEGSLGVVLKDQESGLRTLIDSTSDELKRTRASWATIKGATEAFDKGRKALTSNVDELEILVEQLKKSPEKYKAFKAGVMDSIRNKARRTGTTFANLADPDKQMGSALRVALDDDDIVRLQKQLALAGETSDLAKKVRPEAGSITTPLRQEMDSAGTNMSLGDVANITSGNMFGLLQSASRLLKQEVPMLTDAQRMQVLDLAMSDNPEVVRKALTDQTALAGLINKYGKIVLTGAEGARRASVFEASQPDGLISQLGAQ